MNEIVFTWRETKQATVSCFDNDFKSLQCLGQHSYGPDILMISLLQLLK